MTGLRASRAHAQPPGIETFHVLARRAAPHPDREAIVDHRHRVSYRELLARVDRTGAARQGLATL